MIARGKKLLNVDVFETKGTGKESFRKVYRLDSDVGAGTREDKYCGTICLLMFHLEK